MASISVTESFPTINEEKAKTKLTVQIVEDFKTLGSSPLPLPASVPRPTVGFCAMGSAPFTEENDFTAPVAFGKSCEASGVRSMFLVSSTGAKTGSVFGYVDTLGRREDAYKLMGFGRLGIFRPGMMDRQEKSQTRLKEKIFGALIPTRFIIDTRDIARSMVIAAKTMKDGTHSFDSDDMKQITRL